MKNPFRRHHLTQILKGFAAQSLPLDLFLRNYFRSHRALGSHDRRELSENIYKMIRWQGLIAFLCSEDLSLERRLDLLETLDPEEHLQDTDIPLFHRLSFPQAYFQLLVESLGEERAQTFCLASNVPAPTTIRANTLKTSRQALFDRLSKTHEIFFGKTAPEALHFAKRVNFLLLDEFKEGLFEVQDEASQLAALQVKALPGHHVLDYCAGSGGKTLAIAPSMLGKGQLYLHDIRPHALSEAKIRLRRAGVQNAKILTSEVLRQSHLIGKMDWVLVDAPCSGSGTLRRNPDMKWRFSEKTLRETVALQREIFEKALSFVKPKGFIVYTTCSVLPVENDEQVQYFLTQFPLTLASSPFQSIPLYTKGETMGMDGFYSAVLQKS